MNKNDKKKIVIHNKKEFDCWFSDNVHFIKQDFDLGKNKETIAELWIGFLKYFANFDFDNEEIQIHTSRKTVRSFSFQKNHPEKHSIVVVDPFDKSHNLTQHITMQSNL